MQANEIRTRFIKFFGMRGHREIPKAPLVPPNDPTTLFTSSGMQQLVPFLKGEPHPMGRRLMDSQPCFRSEDIDEVGDNRHITFFEMLGNWSLGDYFKKEQLPWFFEFLTEEIGLKPERLYVTVFEGDAVVPKDEESVTVWKKVLKTNAPARKGADGFEPTIKIYTYGADKNWWSRSGIPANMPPGEIGGPDSEVFYDFQTSHDPKFGRVCHLNCNCGRFVEIGNSVFMQYEKQADDSFKPLPQKNVDFGGGLERIASASQNQPDIFNIDIFTEARKTLEKVVVVSSPESIRAVRIILDHLRAAMFMVSDGFEPANKLQGYVLRRLIRRAALHSKIADIDLDNSINLVIDKLCGSYITVDPNLGENQGRILETIRIEITKFEKTLSQGMKKVLSKVGGGTITGTELFDLYQTYGYPPELVKELAAQKRVMVDGKGFEEAKRQHQETSRTATKGLFKGGLADKSDETVKLHTATHLLHKALREILGNHVRQEGSNITAERLRFDFSHPRKLSGEEIAKVETVVNQKIKEDLPVHRTVEEKDKALKSGALAFFKENYPAMVSVYTIGKDPAKEWFSKELCGGPHVKSTGGIGGIRIIKEQPVQSGIRRIYAELHS